MALQSSGQISLNDIHVEAGGSSGTQAGINDSDIRGLISASSATEIEFADFYGASASPTHVASVTRAMGTEDDMDSSSEALNLTGAGVQTGDLVVIAVSADLRDFSSVGWGGMTLTSSNDLTNSGENPAAWVSYGTWQSSSANPYFALTGQNTYPQLNSVSVVASIFRNVGTTLLGSAEYDATDLPEPPSLSYSSGSTSLIVTTGHADDDDGLMTAMSGYTLSGAAATDSSTRGGASGSCTAIAYKFTTSNVTENPQNFEGSISSSVNSYATTMRF